MTESNTGTKRLAYRFTGDGHILRYKTEFEDGEANVVNVSKGGCGLNKVTVLLSKAEKILILLQLDEAEPLEISARVARIEDDFVAVQFLSISEEAKHQIVKYFAKKHRYNG